MAHAEQPPEQQSEGPKASWTTITIIATIVTLVGFYIGIYLIEAAESRILPEAANLTAPAQLAAEAPAADPAADAAALAAADGQAVYAKVCAACHQPTGEGLPGMYPPLNKSEWVTGDPQVPVKVVLHGLRGPVTVRGNAYAGLMPALKHLSDADIAAVLNHVRTAWDNQAEEIDIAFVRNIRAETAARTASFTASELGH